MNSKSSTDASAKVTPRPRGRPAKLTTDTYPVLSRDAILACALEMAKREPLDAISMVKVAAEMKASSSLAHYYLKGRDDLTSGVINLFSKALVDAAPPRCADARADIEAVARVHHAFLLLYPGIAEYLTRHNRFRLVQKVREGETDYGVQAFERLTSAVMRAGFNSEGTAMLTYLLRMFVLSSALAEARFQTPGFHQQFLDDTLQRFDKSEYPGLHHALHAFARLDGNSVFEHGLKVILDGHLPAKRTRKAPSG